jgi:hypothetical protein
MRSAERNRAVALVPVLGEAPTREVDPDAPDLVAQNTARGIEIDATTSIPGWYS